MQPRVRCVNLDWLECFVLEPLSEPRDVHYFNAYGYQLNVREYGTPIYHEMFTILDSQGHPFIEVRRDPKSKLMEMNACHLRLHNYYCYFDNAAELMQEFINRNGYQFQRISRVDICLDFEKFDRGDDPQKFLYRYMEKVYSKINQSNLSAHGADTWSRREWNSLSWGSQKSDIGTKLYNKTKELYDPILRTYKKPYIRFAWQACGLVDDWVSVTKKGKDGIVYTPQIWRVEFSIRSSVRNWFKIDLDGHERKAKGKQKNLQSVHNTLDTYKGRDRLLVMFAALSRHYFRFKYYKEDVRKDRCEDKILFIWDENQTAYKVGKDNPVAPTKIDKPTLSLLAKLRSYRETHTDEEVRDACAILIKSIESENLRTQLNEPFKYEELVALRLALSAKVNGATQDAAILMKEVIKFLNLNERTLPFTGKKAEQ